LQLRILYRSLITIAVWSCLAITLAGCAAIEPKDPSETINPPLALPAQPPEPHTGNGNATLPKAALLELSSDVLQHIFTQTSQEVRNVRIRINSIGINLPPPNPSRAVQQHGDTENTIWWIQSRADIRLSITNYNDVNIYVKPESGVIQWGDTTIDLARQHLPQAHAHSSIVLPGETQEREIAFLLEPHHILALNSVRPTQITYTIDAPSLMGDIMHDLLDIYPYHFMLYFQNSE
jgi:hypothetical protein